MCYADSLSVRNSLISGRNKLKCKISIHKCLCVNYRKAFHKLIRLGCCCKVISQLMLIKISFVDSTKYFITLIKSKKAL